MLFYVGLILSAFITFWFFVCIRYYYVFMRGIKGPIPVPLIGSAFECKDSTSPIILTQKYHGKWGGVFKVMAGIFIGVSVIDEKLLEYFLSSNTHLRKGMMYYFLLDWLGTGLLTSIGKKWHKRRKIITPAFHFNILSQFTNVFHSNAEILIKKLEKEVDKGSTDIYGYITLCALDIISESAMGTSVNAQINKENEYVTSVKKMCEIVVNRTMNPFIHFNCIYYFTKSYTEEKRCLKILQDYTTSVITARKETLKNQIKENEEGDDVGMKKRFAFLDLLLQSTIDGKPLSDEDIREEVNTFMFAGHDTTTTAISFALFSISAHPDVQNKILEEQETLFGDDSKQRNFSINDLNEMKYLEAVIKESLRLYPPVPIYARQLTEEVRFSKHINIPKQTQMVFPVFVLHRDPKNFPDPEKFDPERFTDGKMQKPFTYLPFSAGPRNCIGQKFAMLEMKAIISKVLLNYELLPVVPEHKLNLVSEATLKSSNGILISVKRRS